MTHNYSRLILSSGLSSVGSCSGRPSSGMAIGVKMGGCVKRKGSTPFTQLKQMHSFFKAATYPGSAHLEREGSCANSQTSEP